MHAHRLNVLRGSLCAAGFLLLLSVALPEDAQSAPVTVTAASAQIIGAPTDVQSDAAAQLAVQFDISPADALVRIRATDSVLKFNRSLRATATSGFTGVWVDQAAGGLVHVSSTDSSDLDAAAIVASQLGLDVVSSLVPFSLKQLDDTKSRVIEGQDSIVGKAAEAVAVAIPLDAVRVWVPTDKVKALAQAAEQAGRSDLVFVPSDPVQTTACSNRYNCGSPLRGGLCILVGSPCSGPKPLGCSSGLTAQTADGTRWLLTSGHCGPVTTSTNWVHGSQYLGPLRLGYVSGFVDAARIRIDNTYWLPITQSWLYTTSTTPVAVNGVGTEGDAIIGIPVCHTGWASGNACGVVSETDKFVSYVTPSVTLDHQMESTACGTIGDSGGPAYYPGNMMAIYQNNYKNNYSCGDPLAKSGGSYYFYIAPTLNVTIFG